MTQDLVINARGTPELRPVLASTALALSAGHTQNDENTNAHIGHKQDYGLFDSKPSA